jgi:two-component system response regulator AlgR
MTLRVLVVDDEALARVPAETGCWPNARHQALCWWPRPPTPRRPCSVCSNSELDAVLADIHMPGVDGLSLAASLRRLPQAPYPGVCHRPCRTRAAGV